MTVEDKRFCVICLSDKTSEQWWRHDRDGQTVCRKCYLKYVWAGHKLSVKKDNDKRNPLNRQKILVFQGRDIFTGRLLRKGKCTECNKAIGDPYINRNGKTAIIKQTHMHHWFYLIIMPWACTVELCVSCHTKKQKKKVG